MKRFPALLPMGVAIVALIAVLPAAGAAHAANVFEQVAEISTETPQSVAVDPKNNVLLVADGGRGTVSRFDLATKTLIGTPLATGGFPTILAADPARDRAYSLDLINRTLSVIDTKAFVVVGAAVPLGAEPKSIVVDGSTGLVYLATTSLDRVSVFDPATTMVTLMGLTLEPRGVDIDESSNTLYVTGATGSGGDAVYAIDLTTKSEKFAPVMVGGKPTVVAVDDAAHQVFVVNSGDNTLSTFDGLTGSSTGASVAVPPGVRGRLVVDPIGHRIYAATGAPEALWVWDTQSRLQVTSELGDGGSTYVARDARTGLVYITDNGRDRVRVIRDGSGVVRIGAADRYAVSALNSQSVFNPGIGTVYIASGETYPDALSAAAAAGAQQGVVLLTRKDVLPDAVRAELTRLSPQRIIVVGGTVTISPAVEAALLAFSPAVSRIAAADRYDVSASISRSAFGSGVDAAYVATGENFPDALSAAAAAGASKAPVLLVMRDSVPASVAGELARLTPGKIIVVGGPNSVSDAVLSSLNMIAPATRISGIDRFEGSAKLSHDTFAKGSGVAYVASGSVFADALSASATAIANGSPVLLLASDGIPAPVQAELTRLSPSRIVIVGGPATVSETTATTLGAFVR